MHVKDFRVLRFVNHSEIPLLEIIIHLQFHNTIWTKNKHLTAYLTALLTWILNLENKTQDLFFNLWLLRNITLSFKIFETCARLYCVVFGQQPTQKVRNVTVYPLLKCIHSQKVTLVADYKLHCLEANHVNVCKVVWSTYLTLAVTFQSIF